MKCRHPSPSFENIDRAMVLAVKCDGRSECRGGLDEQDCNTDLVTYVAGELCYYLVTVKTGELHAHAVHFKAQSTIIWMLP